MKPKDSRPEYIVKNGALYQWVDAYKKDGCYIRCNEPHHFFELSVSGSATCGKTWRLEQRVKWLREQGKTVVVYGGKENDGRVIR